MLTRRSPAGYAPNDNQGAAIEFSDVGSGEPLVGVGQRGLRAYDPASRKGEREAGTAKPRL